MLLDGLNANLNKITPKLEANIKHGDLMTQLYFCVFFKGRQMKNQKEKKYGRKERKEKKET